MSCPACGHAVGQGARFCEQCGEKLASTAVGVSPMASERAPADYTPKHLADKILRSKSALEGERKQVTVLFVDVEGSTELAERLDPEAWHAILDRFFQILADGVHRFEGTVNQYTGDGIMALFGAPIAHEDHAQRACYAALHLQGELRQYAQALKRERALRFSFRLGLNSGDVVVGKIGDDLRMDYTAQGHTVNLAQRMEQLSEAGKPYLAEATANCVAGYFELEDLGEFRVKGASAPLRVYGLEGVGRLRTRLDLSRARGLSRFVGRGDEMAILETALERARAGQGQVVCVVSQAGTGKSRLCFEFLERHRHEPRVHETHGLAHGKNLPFAPVLELLRDAFGIDDEDSERTARQKIAGAVVLLDENEQEALPLLFEFLGVPDPERPAPSMAPQLRNRRLLDLVGRLLQARGRRELAIYLLEDLHWFDVGSESFVEQLVDSLPGTQTLLLVTLRPEFEAEWLQRPTTQRIALRPLGVEAMRELLEHLMGGDASVAALPDRIREWTGGNPFFIEELVQSLVEAGDLEGERGAYRLLRPVAELRVPDSVRAILAARIDRLDERDKHLLQTASVLGRSFTEVLLAQIADLPERDLGEALRQLERAEFLFEQALYPEREYAFKHPLTQEVALASQLGARRREVHGRVARALIELRGEGLDEQAPLLAHHFEAAGEALEAARWHRRAAEWAGFAHMDAMLRHWTKVSELLRDEPESDETLTLGARAAAQILWTRTRTGAPMEELVALFESGRELAERAGETHVLAQLLNAYGTALQHDGRPLEAESLLAEAMELAERTGDSALRIVTRFSLGFDLAVLGSTDAAARLFSEALELCRGDTSLGTEYLGYSPYLALRLFSARARCQRGQIREAHSELARLVDLCREKNELVNLAITLSAFGDLALWSGPIEGSLAHAREAAKIAEMLDNPISLVVAGTGLGTALVVAGMASEAAEVLERALTIMQRFRVFLQFRPVTLAMRAAALLANGESNEALSCAREAVGDAVRQGSRPAECSAHLVLTRVLLKMNGSEARAEIEAALRRVEAIVEEGEIPVVVPQLREQQARLAGACGETARCQAELREAHRLYDEIGATGHAKRLAGELGL